MSAAVLEMPSLVTAADVQTRLKCSRSEAYEHLRACARLYHGRSDDARGMLRATREAWFAYEQEVLLCGSTSEAKSGGVGTTTRRASGSARAHGVQTRKPPSNGQHSANVTRLIPRVRAHET